MKETDFINLNLENIKGHLILLDIDGTIVKDGERELTNEMIQKIILLRQNNELFFCSNKKDDSRLKEISQKTGVSRLASPHKKPNRKILKHLDNNKNLPILVIGDKFLTDGLFAKNIKAEFIKVKRITSPNDKWPIKLIYFVDDLIFKLINKIWHI